MKPSRFILALLLSFSNHLCSAAPEAELTWHHALKDAYAEALKEKKPILLVLGAEWCGPCKVLDKEMAAPDAAKALSRWTRVHLNVDNSEGAAAMLQTGAIPLLRVLSPAGRRVDFKEGVLKSADLAKWLDASYEPALAASGEELMGADPPDAAALAKLLDHLSDPDAALREAAIKRLAPHPAAAASAVADAFAKGNLLTRLACLDLLAEWKAPIADLDPWQPETLTPDRLKKLLDWAAAAKSRPATKPATKPAALTPQELEEARREIARMLASPAQDEVRAARERLARLGRVLLPQVHTQLQIASTDTARERLLALRYRLSASDALAIGWPTGLERLASTDAQVRHVAAEELLSRATSDDGPLLLELFADPDALVREISLRGLQTVGKGDAAKALVTLLNDPDLNVRAAVLKQLAESPSAGMITSIIEFAQKENDPDLVVHAIRVLRESKSERAIDGLLGFLDHSNWRVRAEAAEALTEMTGHRSGSASVQRQADVNTAMLKLLDDPDGFVVSRAVIALTDADLAMAVEPMVNAAARHPDLAAEIIRGLTKGSKTRAAAERHLRAFCFHKDNQVRSQAIVGLCSVTGEVEKEMKSLLKDDVETVRMSAASSLFTMINSWRPNGRNSTHVESGFLGFGSRVVQDKADPWQWTVDFRAGKNRAAWLNELVPDLDKLTTAPGAETRIDGALPLLALGKQDKALEVIRASARAEPRLVDNAASALPWLDTDQRVELFKQLAPIAAERHALGNLANQLAIIADAKAAAPLWDLPAADSTDIHTADIVYIALQQIYYGERNYAPPQPASQQLRNQVISEAKARVERGSEMQRLIALAMLLDASPADAAEACRKILDDPKSPQSLHADALQIRLLSLNKADGRKSAISALSSKSPPDRLLAVKFLAAGGAELQSLRQEIYLRFDNPEVERDIYVGQNTPVILEAPAGVTAEMLKPLLADPDGETAAYAGYLLALMGDRAGMESLIKHWRASPKDHTAQRLVYRAAAALRDDSLTPILEEVYRAYEKENYYVREFYWTIRLIGGEKALKLRKTIRDELGMEQLR